MKMNFPDLNLPEEGERDKWAQQILDGASAIADSTDIITWRNKYYARFNQFKGNFDGKDYEYITNTFGDYAKPARFANHPLIEPLITKLVGEYTAKSIPFGVHKVNKNAINDKLDIKAHLVVEKLLEPVWNKLNKKHGADLPIEKKTEGLSEEGKKKFQTYNYRDLEEEAMYSSIDYLMHRHRLMDDFGRQLFDILINSDCFGKIDFIDGDPVPRRVNLLRALFAVPPQDYVWKDISKELEWFGEDLACTYDEVINNYGPRMSPDNLEKFKKNVDAYRDQGRNLGWNMAYKNYWYTDDGLLMIRVIDLEAKVKKNETFRVDKKKFPVSEIRSEKIPMSEVWEFFKVGHDIYQYDKRKNQIPNRDNYRDMMLSYYGVLTSYSFYEKCMPLQTTYNTLYHTFDFLCNQAGGKAIEIDLANIPSGYKPNDIAYMAKVMGIILKQKQEGSLGNDSPISKEIDFGISSSIEKLIAAMGVIERTAERMTGVSRGEIPADSTNGVAEQNVLQSTYATQPVFDALRLVTETGLQRSMDLIKYLWAGEESKSYFMGDMAMKLFSVPDSCRKYDYGLFVVNNMEDARNKKFVMDLASKALATDANLVLELVQMNNAGSSVEAEQILKEGIDVIRQQAQKQKEAELQLQAEKNKIAAKANELTEKALQIKATIPLEVAKIGEEKAVKVAEIGKEGKENVKDMENKGALDKQMLKDYSHHQTEQMKAENTPVKEETAEPQPA